MDFILKLKNWQLFLIILFLPWFVAIGLNLSLKLENNSRDVIMGIITIFYYSIFIIWNYKVIKTFNNKMPILKSHQLKRLNLLLIILVLYAIYLVVPMSLKSSGNTVLRIISPLILLISAYAIIFMIFCTAKTLKGIQLKDQLRTSDVIVEMFVIFYFPIGVWWLQKKVNRFLIEYYR